LRVEMEKLEAAVQQGLEDKRKMAEEMERLGQEAEEQLQEQKEILKTLDLELNGDSSASQAVSPIATTIVADTVMHDATAIPLSEVHQRQISEVPLENGQSDVPASFVDSTISETGIYTTDIDKMAINTDPHMEGNEAQEDIKHKRTLNAALQHACATQELTSEISTDSDAHMDNSSSDTPDLADIASVLTSGKNDETGDQENIEHMHFNHTEPVEGESDLYEPPEATPPAPEIAFSPESSPFSPAPPQTISENAHTDLQIFVPSSVGPSEISVERSAVPVQAGKANENEATVGTIKPMLFTPYESPLKQFRAYRFHPAFEQDISGGYKSMTYSNNIKSDKELCRFEFAGGICNDATCEFQHFRDMALPDDAILVELGNSAGYSEEEKPKFVAGLREVLQDLRVRKIKDFRAIASEIAAFRARFLGDDSKVLLLDGISL
jgi:hypothetical protein